MAAIQHRVSHLQQHRATPDTHLAAVFNGTAWSTVRSAEIITALRTATTLMGPQVGFTPEDVSARLMRAGGAMALLMASMTERRSEERRSVILLSQYD